jgi:hypothetical protein
MEGTRTDWINVDSDFAKSLLLVDAKLPQGGRSATPPRVFRITSIKSEEACLYMSF